MVGVNCFVFSNIAVGTNCFVFSNTAVSDHFLSDNPSPNDIELIPLELIQSSRDALRKAREEYLYRKGSNS